MKKPIRLVMFSCGHRGKQPLVTIERGDDWTRSYVMTEKNATRLSDVMRMAVIRGEYLIMPHSMGWTAYPRSGRPK